MANLNANKIIPNTDALIMYVDMNSFFASCEQQKEPALRNKPVGVCAYVSENAVIIAASKEAKKYGAKTGMRVSECRQLCPNMIFVPTRPVQYRRFHVAIMKILHSYCDDVIAKSIDEAVMNLTAYRYVYKDVLALAKCIKHDMANSPELGEYLTCSIGISSNTFLAKLATEIKKPDGLIWIRPDNIDNYLSHLQLIDLPGIGKANERKLRTAGINSPLALRYASEAVLRKVFGGIVGNYWYARLHFGEVDLYTSSYKSMSVMRSISRQIRAQRNSLIALFTKMCTQLEQRLVKQSVFCKQVHFYTNYYNISGWESLIHLTEPIQDGMEIMQQIMQRINVHEEKTGANLFSSDIKSMCIVVSSFVDDKTLQYSLFSNKIQKDLLRKTVYKIKDKFGKNSVRKASEIIETGIMKDAIGFGSVKDLYDLNPAEEGKNYFNQYLLEDDNEME